MWRRLASTRCSTSRCPAGTRAQSERLVRHAGYLAHYADVAASASIRSTTTISSAGRKGAIRQPDSYGGLSGGQPRRRGGDVNPLDHFLTFGIHEGRQAVNDGVWH